MIFDFIHRLLDGAVFAFFAKTVSVLGMINRLEVKVLSWSPTEGIQHR